MTTKQKYRVSSMLMSISIGLVGCDSATSSNDSSNDATTGVTTGYAIKGKLAGTGFKNAQVCLNGTCVYADQTTGEYTIPSSATTKASARATSARTTSASATVGTTVGYAYIIVGNDTLKEIPVLNWNSIIPEKYIVQRNVAVTVPKKYPKGDVQFVYWDNDSIAHAVGVPKVSGLKHSAYVYTYYDSSSFANHDTIFSWFARIKMNDLVKSGTGINKLTYDAGDIVVDSSDFQTNVFTTGYYKYVPAGDTVDEYTSKVAEAKYEASIGDTVVYTIDDTSSNDDSRIHISSGYGCGRHAHVKNTQGSGYSVVCSDSGYFISATMTVWDSSVDSVLFRATVTDTSTGADSAFAEGNSDTSLMAKKSGLECPPTDGDLDQVGLAHGR